MYRLPNQFDASASRQDLAAAGGGSTSTTCSSCIVTLIGASALSAVVLGSLGPIATTGRNTPASDDTGASNAGLPDQPTLWPDAPPPEPVVAPDAGHAMPPAPVPMSRTKRKLLGAFAVPLAVIAGGVMGAANVIFGLFVAVAVIVGIYATVYERSGRSLGSGIGVGIGLLLGTFVAAAAEMMLWLGVLK
ncbi:hypothetical protein AB8E26_04150 [Stenotrophomonas rhizophila]|jgi:hypothetical protein|uniref:hypothetical protein n=1 Tax=Stenotrophomonas rhizophila TaxID=216778 RepID=UPI003511B299